MERESPSDEEEDHEALIENNESKTHQRSSFEISEEFKTNNSKTLSGFKKRYLFAIFLPIFMIILYFSIDFTGLFRNLYTVRTDGSQRSDHMRESELRALHLLKDQQSSLVNIWNQTFPNPNLNSPNSNLDKLEDLRSALLRQIRLNKQVQQILFSSHRVGNESASLDYNADDPTLDFNRCRKLDTDVDRKAIEWKPKSDKFLFAICTSGQMSNHLICLEKHMFFAALLGRVLVLPSSKFDYNYENVLDIAYINDCFGRKVVVSFKEFSDSRKNRVHIDRLICYMVSPPCYVDDDHVKKLMDIGITMGKRETAWSDDKKKRDGNDVTMKFACNDEVLAIGDVFYADIEEEWLMQPGGPLAHKCKTIIQPSQLIMLTAQRFIQTFLGGNFIALHFRRHGFLKFCNVKKESCFFPIPQAADCILRSVERSNAPVIYLSTDAADSETDLLQSLIVLDGKAVPLVKRPAHNSAEKWDALLSRKGLESDAQVDAMLDKTICALSTVFIGAPGSTFTEDIIRLRKDWGSRSICDEYLCHGEHPNFQADLE